MQTVVPFEYENQETEFRYQNLTIAIYIVLVSSIMKARLHEIGKP